MIAPRPANAGFTLIELVIVITIMGILAALVIPTFTSYLRKARVQSTKVALNTIQNAIQAYHADTASYPASLADLKTKPVDEKAAKRWDGPYISKEPVDGWGTELVYSLNPKGTQPPYELYSWGPHKEGSPQEEWIHAQEE